jgi:hypothetical protein
MQLKMLTADASRGCRSCLGGASATEREARGPGCLRSSGTRRSPKALAPWTRFVWEFHNGPARELEGLSPPFSRFIPTYLKSVTILEPVGSIAAETSAVVDNMQRSRPRPMKWDASALFPRYRYALALVAVVAIVTFGLIFFVSKRTEHSTSISTSGTESPVVKDTSGNVNINFGSPTPARPEK